LLNTECSSRDSNPPPGDVQICAATPACPAAVPGVAFLLEMVVGAVFLVIACVLGQVLPAERPTSGDGTPRVLCVLWYVLFPCICLAESLRIFVLPCLLSYTIGACGKFWLQCGRRLCCCLSCKCVRRKDVLSLLCERAE
jgi:hypothetical protein